MTAWTRVVHLEISGGDGDDQQQGPINWTQLTGLAAYPLRRLELSRYDGSVGTCKGMGDYVSQAWTVLKLIERRPFVYGAVGGRMRFGWRVNGRRVVVASPRLELLAASLVYAQQLLGTGGLQAALKAAQTLKWIALPQAVAMRHSPQVSVLGVGVRETREQLAVALVSLQVMCIGKWEHTADREDTRELGAGMLEWVIRTARTLIDVCDLSRDSKASLRSLLREMCATQLLYAPADSADHRISMVLAAIEEFRVLRMEGREALALALIPSMAAHLEPTSRHGAIAPIGPSGIASLDDAPALADKVNDFTKDLDTIIDDGGDPGEQAVL